jgi:hypothetical protein
LGILGNTYTYTYTLIGLNLKYYFTSTLYNPIASAELSTEDKASYKKLSLLNIFRSIIKKAIMTIPYPGSPGTKVDYITESFDRYPNPDYNK